MLTMSPWLKISFVLVTMVFHLLTFSSSSIASFGGMKIQVLASISLDESAGRLKNPSGLFFDENKQRLYIADSNNKRIVSLDSEYRYLAALSKKEIVLPISIVRNSLGVFYILDAHSREIVLINVKRDLIESLNFTGIPSGNNPFVPGKIAIDKKDNLYIVDKLNKRIVIVNAKGQYLRSLAQKESEGSGFNDVRIDDKGYIYCLDTISRSVYIFDSSGRMISSFGGKNTNLFLFPVSLAIGNNGLIYVLDRHSGKISVFSVDGKFHYSISTKGVSPGELSTPSYLWMNRSNIMYITDGDRIQVV